MEGDSRGKKPKPKSSPESNTMNTKKKTKVNEFEYCKVCNRNHNQGQRHKYFPSHIKLFSNFLSRFQNKITNIRFFLRNPSIICPEHSFWCVFCDSEVDELGSSFACKNAINHLASADHLKNLKHFMWKYGGGMDRVDAFRILEADVDKWEKKCTSLKSEAKSSDEVSQELLLGFSNDIHNELNFENVNNFERNINHHLISNIPNGVTPLQYHTNECQISHSGLPGVANSGTSLHGVTSSVSAETFSMITSWNSSYAMGLQNITQVASVVPKEAGGSVYSGAPPPLLDTTAKDHLGSRAQKEGGGNVHSGAPPPWLEVTEGDRVNPKPVLSSSVSSSNQSLKSKLNPKRVGAAWAEKRKMEMEMEKRGEYVKSDCDPNWLPNFGRVWQSGSRKESRKEFEIEKQKQVKQPKVKSPLEMPVTIQPYISKRMRRDTIEDCGDPYLNK